MVGICRAVGLPRPEADPRVGPTKIDYVRVPIFPLVTCGSTSRFDMLTVPSVVEGSLPKGRPNGRVGACSHLILHITVCNISREQ